MQEAIFAETNPTYTYYVTPIKGALLTAVDGKIITESVLDPPVYNASYDKRIINRGIHAFRQEWAALEQASFFLGKAYVYDAIIPKGAKYYIGNNNDIVSDKLIIFVSPCKYYEEYKK